MPTCTLCCEGCGTQKSKTLSASEFAVVLANGKLWKGCSKCRQKTTWRLAVPPRPEPQVRRELGPRRVLVIDDDSNTLRILQLMLRPKDYTVTTAPSAEEAIAQLQTNDFDVIVSDIRMPGFDGQSLFRFIAAFLPSYARKVVFLTGDQSERTLRFLRECGCPYTFKPIDLAELQSLIREVG